MSESILKKSGNRMQIIIYLAIAIAALLIQSSLIDLMAIRGIKPDLLLIFLVIISKREGRFWGTTSGFGIGLLQDIFETQFLGLSSLCKSIAGFVAAWLEAKQPQQRILVWGTFLFIIGLLHNLIFYSISVGWQRTRFFQNHLSVYFARNVVHLCFGNNHI